MIMEYPKHNDVTPLIVCLCALYRPEIYIEFGTQRGYTFNKVLPYIQEKAISVDVANYREIKESDKVEKYVGTTCSYYLTFPRNLEKSVDVVFIDAYHAADAVYRDVQIARELIKTSTGLILLHDTYPITEELKSPKYCSDAWKTARNLKNEMLNWRKETHLEVLTLPGPFFGLTILREVPAGGHF